MCPPWENISPPLSGYALITTEAPRAPVLFCIPSPRTHQPNASQLGYSPQPSRRAAFPGQVPQLQRASGTDGSPRPWGTFPVTLLGTVGLPALPETCTWDQAAGSSPQKGQTVNFSPELITKGTCTHTSPWRTTPVQLHMLHIPAKHISTGQQL